MVRALSLHAPIVALYFRLVKKPKSYQRLIVYKVQGAGEGGCGFQIEQVSRDPGVEVLVMPSEGS